jgi:formylmethanofuran dehydrogenase subunit E
MGEKTPKELRELEGAVRKLAFSKIKCDVCKEEILFMHSNSSNLGNLCNMCVKSK